MIDPVTGLERIYSEILVMHRYGPQEYDGMDLWKWDKLRDSVYYDENFRKRNDPSQKNNEIIAFATQWLDNTKPRTVSGRRFNGILPIHRTEKPKSPIDNVFIFVSLPWRDLMLRYKRRKCGNIRITDYNSLNYQSYDLSVVDVPDYLTQKRYIDTDVLQFQQFT